MNFVYTSIEIFGILIEEPITSLTDVITGVVGIVAFFRLNKLNLKHRGHLFFKHYFLFIGIATVCAGVLGHATQYLVGFNAKAIGWTFSALALCCLENAGLEYQMAASGSRRLQSLQWLFWGQFILFFVLVINPSTRVFELVQVNASLAMVGVALPLFIWTYRLRPSKGSWAVVGAILAGLFPGLVFRSQFSLHTYLNYHDISHLLMAGCVYLLYRGARKMGKEYESGLFNQPVNATSARGGFKN
jgi:hypothetical protein